MHGRSLPETAPEASADSSEDRRRPARNALPRARRRRSLTLLMAAVCLVLTGSSCSTEGPGDAVAPDGTGAGAAGGSTAAPEPPRVSAVDVLRSWDLSRSRAFAAGDVDALRRLYVPGSGAGTSDVRLLRAYLDRGLRVEGMRMQVLALGVLERSPDVLRLRVTDRLAGAVAVGEGLRTALPRDRATRRVLLLRRTSGSGEWQMAAVSGSGRMPGGR